MRETEKVWGKHQTSGREGNTLFDVSYFRTMIILPAAIEKYHYDREYTCPPFFFYPYDGCVPGHDNVPIWPGMCIHASPVFDVL